MDAATQRYGWALWALTLVFLLRVVGQMVQRWAPQSFLPSFHAFQGSQLPYPVLLSVQLILLALMARTAHRVSRGTLRPKPRAGHFLVWFGGLYLTAAIGRIVIGLTVPSAPAWFSTWIPAIFHLVLAGFVVTLARYHREAFTLSR